MNHTFNHKRSSRIEEVINRCKWCEIMKCYWNQMKQNIIHLRVTDFVSWNAFDWKEMCVSWGRSDYLNMSNNTLHGKWIGFIEWIWIECNDCKLKSIWLTIMNNQTDEIQCICHIEWILSKRKKIQLRNILMKIITCTNYQ